MLAEKGKKKRKRRGLTIKLQTFKRELLGMDVVWERKLCREMFCCGRNSSESLCWARREKENMSPLYNNPIGVVARLLHVWIDQGPI